MSKQIPKSNMDMSNNSQPKREINKTRNEEMEITAVISSEEESSSENEI